MQKKLTAALCLICVLALSACKTVGPVACPRLAEPPPSVMQPPETEKKVRRELFKPQEQQTTKSAPSKKSSALTEFAKDLAELQCKLYPGSEICKK